MRYLKDSFGDGIKVRAVWGGETLVTIGLKIVLGQDHPIETDIGLDSAQARKLAAKLLLAADEIDGLKEEPPAWDPRNPSEGDVVEWGSCRRVYRRGEWFRLSDGVPAMCQDPTIGTYRVIARGGKPVAA